MSRSQLVSSGVIALVALAVGVLLAGQVKAQLLTPSNQVARNQALVHSVHDDQVLSRPHTQNLARNWMLAHVPKGTKIVSEPLRADAWDSYWEGRRSPTWFLTGGLNPLAASFTAVKAILTGERTGPTGQIDRRCVAVSGSGRHCAIGFADRLAESFGVLENNFDGMAVDIVMRPGARP